MRKKKSYWISILIWEQNNKRMSHHLMEMKMIIPQRAEFKDTLKIKVKKMMLQAVSICTTKPATFDDEAQCSPWLLHTLSRL